MLITENAILRPSGSTLIQAIYKRCADATQQVRLMAEAPTVFAPVLACGTGGYAMPVLQPLRNAKDVSAALTLLADYWNTKGTVRTAGCCTRIEYQQYVAQLPADGFLLKIAARLYRATRYKRGTPAASLHGDATLAHAMLYNDIPRWIDPNPRCVPLEAEVDCGKLLQSVFGYDHCVPEVAEIVDKFMRARKVNMLLTQYYFSTHLVRLWRYQPQHRAWALGVAREIFRGGAA